LIFIAFFTLFILGPFGIINELGLVLVVESFAEHAEVDHGGVGDVLVFGSVFHLALPILAKIFLKLGSPRLDRVCIHALFIDAIVAVLATVSVLVAQFVHPQLFRLPLFLSL